MKSEPVDQKVEAQISRYLDDELSVDERAEVSRAVLRDPAAREMLESYRANDAAASAALRAALGGGAGPAIDPAALAAVEREPVRRIGPWVRYAAAAALLLGVTAWVWVEFSKIESPTPTPPAGEAAVAMDRIDAPESRTSEAAADPTTTIENLSVSREYLEAIMREASVESGEPSGGEAGGDGPVIQHGLIQVIDESGDQIYWLQIEREQTTAEVEAMEL